MSILQFFLFFQASRSVLPEIFHFFRLFYSGSFVSFFQALDRNFLSILQFFLFFQASRSVLPEIFKQIEEALNVEKYLLSRGISQPQNHLSDASKRLKSLEFSLNSQISQWEYNFGEHSDFLAALNRFSQWIDRKWQIVRDLLRDPLVRRFRTGEGSRSKIEEIQIQGENFIKNSATQLEGNFPTYGSWRENQT